MENNLLIKPTPKEIIVGLAISLIKRAIERGSRVQLNSLGSTGISICSDTLGAYCRVGYSTYSGSIDTENVLGTKGMFMFYRATKTNSDEDEYVYPVAELSVPLEDKDIQYVEVSDRSIKINSWILFILE